MLVVRVHGQGEFSSHGNVFAGHHVEAQNASLRAVHQLVVAEGRMMVEGCGSPKRNGGCCGGTTQMKLTYSDGMIWR